MLPIDFGNLRNDQPDLAVAFDQIEQWIRQHPRATFLDVRRLVAFAPQLSPLTLATALGLLVSNETLRIAYRVVAPTNHVLADDFFESPEDIPEKMSDTAEEWFSTDNAEVVPVFRAASNADAR